MPKKKIVTNRFEWISVDNRVDKLGLSLPPRKKEDRRPLLWLVREDEELYLVNSSNEVLQSVIVGFSSWEDWDDDSDIIVRSNKKLIEYKDVAIGDAIKIEEFKPWDSDQWFTIVLKITTKTAQIEIMSPCKKGGINETVLLWDTKESGKDVTIKYSNSD